jgi:hypothetical protein
MTSKTTAGTLRVVGNSRDDEAADYNGRVMNISVLLAFIFWR